MKTLYLSSHSVLEYQELRILTELDNFYPEKPLNIEVFSMGAYNNPTQSGDYLRNIIPKGRFYPDLYELAMQSDKDNIHPKLVEWADFILMMHNSGIPGQKEQQRWLVRNWPLFEKMKKKVGWRSIGQCNPDVEHELKKYRDKGMTIIRMSPLERQIPDYAGEDAMIRFSEDPEEFRGWTGEKKYVITISQSFKKRGEHLGFHLFDRITNGFNRKVFGTENYDLGDLWAGPRNYEELKKDLREARVFLYFGTQPVPYTLSFLEAMMTGVPMVVVGKSLRNTGIYKWPNYEAPDLITSGVNGYVSDSIDELRGYIQLLLENDEVARRISEAGRKTAIEVFDRKKANKEWYDYLIRI